MEDKNRFDLEKALLAWREDCASRPAISLEAARELESDLRERVADLQKQGLSENEAFREAVRQVGSPAALAREFTRENPWPVWRDRLLWMVAAGFAFSIWQMIAYGAISWLLHTFWDLFPLHLSTGVAVSLGTNLPVLTIAVLLATGRLGKLAGRLHYFVQSRRRLALTGLGLLVVAIFIMLFGLSQWQPMFLFTVSAWPLALLLLGIFLFRPISNAESPSLRSRMATAPAVFWRERVWWMTIGALMLGFWRILSGLGERALFHTGHINEPFYAGLVICADLLLQLSPVILLILLGQCMRRGKVIPAATLVRPRPLLVLLPPLLFAWTGLQLWSLYSGIPPEIRVSFSDLLSHYASTLQWLWPVALALLLLWLARNRLEQEEDSEFAK